ncbi:unnamed protein product [Closterium sp. NIES-65]|nr:unnamed protein product [Closterium sp. NIES-65]
MEVPPSVEITDGQRLQTEQLQDESSMDGVQQSGGQEIGEQQTWEQQIGEQQTGEQQIGEQQTGEPQTGEQEMWGIRDGGRVLAFETITAPPRRSTRITRGIPPLKDLSVNSLYGPIPQYLTHSDSIEFLSLYANQLTGPIPAFSPMLKSLQIHHNFLFGRLPAARHLIDCDVSHNCLVGGSAATCPTLSAQRPGGKCTVAKRACACKGGKVCVVCVPVYDGDDGDGSSEGVENADNPPDAFQMPRGDIPVRQYLW